MQIVVGTRKETAIPSGLVEEDESSKAVNPKALMALKCCGLSGKTHHCCGPGNLPETTIRGGKSEKPTAS